MRPALVGPCWIEACFHRGEEPMALVVNIVCILVLGYLIWHALRAYSPFGSGPEDEDRHHETDDEEGSPRTRE